jgi:hypothetical protein
MFIARLIWQVWNQDHTVFDATSAVNHIHERKGHILTRRPYQVGWFASQLAMYVVLDAFSLSPVFQPFMPTF